jgi:hypothetical protein
VKGALDAAVPLISKVKPSPEINDSIWKKLAGEPVADPVPAPISAEEKHVMRLFWVFTEIHGCVERLKDCEIYVHRFPFGRSRVTRPAYLQFVVEGHLHEIYLLRERLEILAKTVARLFKRDKSAKQIAKVADILVKFVTQSLSGFTNVRGAHVHQWRYTHQDIERLNLIATLRKAKRSPFSRPLLPLERIAIEETHARLRKQAKTWNQRVSHVMEKFFKHLNPVILDGNKEMKLPGTR